MADEIIDIFKEYKIDEQNGKHIKIYDYSDLTIQTAATAAYIIRNLYDKGQIELLEYGGFLALDEDNYLFGYSIFSKGGIVQTTCDPQIIYKNISLSNAKKIIFFHNHPSGNLEPSGADINVTYMTSSILTALGIEYVDHVIVSPLGFYSFAEDKKYDFFNLTRYAASGMKIIEGNIDVYVPELKLFVEKSNVTELFYKKKKSITDDDRMKSEMENFITKHTLGNEDCIGFLAINNALYPDFISAEKDFDLKSQDYFKKFSKTLMSACTIHMAIFINKKIENNVALKNEDIDFFTRLGSLAQMVGIKVIDIMVRDKETGQYSSMISQIVNVLNQKMSSTSGSDGLKNLKNYFKFIKL
jgi:DNA repair protein RadC